MSGPESIPEDRQESFQCDCGGNVTRNVTGQWECDSCDEKLGGESADYEP